MRSPIEWGDKISAGLKQRPTTTKNCEGCGTAFEVIIGREHLSRWCGWECAYKNNYTTLGDRNPVRKKAKVLAANLLMGRGKLDFLEFAVGIAIDRPCKYCKEILSLDNITIDHKKPYRDSNLRRNTADNAAYRRVMDAAENLQIICKDCNQHKGQLTDEQFQRFIDFLNTDDDMRRVLLVRLAQSRTFWINKRRAS